MLDNETDVRNALAAFGGISLRYRTFGSPAAHLTEAAAKATPTSEPHAANGASVSLATEASAAEGNPPVPGREPEGSTFSHRASIKLSRLADVFRMVRLR